MSTCRSGGITVGFDEVGEGSNTMLLVHGHPFNRSMWRPQLTHLNAPNWRVLAPDLRGYGESTVVQWDVMTMMRTTRPEGAAAALRGRAERPAYEATLAALDVPALIVVGADDAFTSRDDAEPMHMALKNAELLWLDGVGHMPNLEAETEFNTALRRLLERVEATA